MSSDPRCGGSLIWGVPGTWRIKAFQISIGNLHLCEPGAMWHPTLCPSFGNLHGQTYQDFNEHNQEVGKLRDPHQRHEHVLQQGGVEGDCNAKWYGGQVKTDTKPYTLELFSDSDWASCKVSRRSTSSGPIFLNGCLIHSHSRSQTSVSLSSMEAGILAATNLLTETIYVKQVLQFLVNDIGGLVSQRCAEMRLRLDSTSAQAFFTRLGPGRAKHLSARLLWTQHAMRRQWFVVDKISKKENPADLNTKALSKERREFLIKRVGLVCERFEDDEEVPYQGKKRQLVKMLVNMIMAANLRGCDGGPLTWTSSWAPGRWMQIDKDALEHCHCMPLWWPLWWRWWWFDSSTGWLWRWRFRPTTRQHRDRSEKQCALLSQEEKNLPTVKSWMETLLQKQLKKKKRRWAMTRQLQKQVWSQSIKFLKSRNYRSRCGSPSDATSSTILSFREDNFFLKKTEASQRVCQTSF